MSMSLLEAHLREIELCTATISDLQFLPTKIFTNAILKANDITTLIRDTEAHERALFSLAPSQDILTSTGSDTSRTRSTRYGVSKLAEASRGPRRNTSVAVVLGGDMAERLRRERMNDTRSRRTTGMTPASSPDVELLLQGAEKICAVYPIHGALEKIASLRIRHRTVKASVDHFDRLIAEQSTQLKQMNRPSSWTSRLDADDDGSQQFPVHRPVMSEDELRREEEEVRELELKKRALEERVEGMEKDLGGLSRPR